MPHAEGCEEAGSSTIPQVSDVSCLLERSVWPVNLEVLRELIKEDGMTKSKRGTECSSSEEFCSERREGGDS